MPRSHPPTLLTLVSRTLREECAIGPGAKVLLAVSGGGDSMALLHTLALLRQKLKFELITCGVDHGLRAEAHQELDLAASFASSLGIPFTRVNLSVARGSNLQARARDARYGALRRVAAESGAAFLATAHHAEDRAETVLERLLRGAGPRGLSVLPPRDGSLIRPMIRAGKSAVLAHLARHRVPFSTDPSNLDPRFLRVRIRHELLPLLAELSPGIVLHLNSLADQLSSGDVPEVHDARGGAIALGRAQIDQLQRARKLGRKTLTLRVAGGLEVRLEAASGRLESVGARLTPRKNKKSERH